MVSGWAGVCVSECVHLLGFFPQSESIRDRQKVMPELGGQTPARAKIKTAANPIVSHNGAEDHLRTEDIKPQGR